MKVLIIGGNRFFGRHLATECLRAGDQLTILNRGNIADNLVGRLQRMQVDRTNFEAMKAALKGKTWDVVYDQVCYDSKTALEAVKLFRGYAGRYVYTSSISVYGKGVELKEGNFLAKGVTGSTAPADDYGRAKLEAEAVFLHEMPKISVSVRLGMVAGVDDYTGRLQWHLDHVLQSKPMRFPNKDACMSFIQSEQAGQAIHLIGKSNALESVNCAAPGGVALSDFIRMVESGVKRKALITSTGDESPYGISDDLWVDTGKLHHLGIKLAPASEWMPETIASLHKNSLKV